jgi:predicted ABC-type ATPase
LCGDADCLLTLLAAAVGAQVDNGAVEPRQPPVIVWVTGAPGSGKTTFVKELMGAAAGGAVDLQRWPPQKLGTTCQLSWHARADGRVAVAGLYSFPSGDDWWALAEAPARGTSPPNGGTDVLQPQAVGLLAQLLCGELPACGRAPEVVVVEACAKAKVGGPRVQQALLRAPHTVVLELTCAHEEAVERLALREHTHDGKGVRGVKPEVVHARYASEVAVMKAALAEHVDADRIEWYVGSPAELRMHVPLLGYYIIYSV